MNVFAIPGSLRKGSLNRALLVAAQQLAPAGMSIAIYDGLRHLPHYDADIDGPKQPDVVVQLKDAIRACDGLLIACPEYNYGVPGVLKNGIDWVSRPPSETPLRGKPTALLGAAGGMSGTIRAQLHLRQVLVFTQTPVMLAPEVLIARAAERFTDGQLTEPTTREVVRKMLEAFAAWIQRFEPEPSARTPWQRTTGAVDPGR